MNKQKLKKRMSILLMLCMLFSAVNIYAVPLIIQPDGTTKPGTKSDMPTVSVIEYVINETTEAQYQVKTDTKNLTTLQQDNSQIVTLSASITSFCQPALLSILKQTNNQLANEISTIVCKKNQSTTSANLSVYATEACAPSVLSSLKQNDSKEIVTDYEKNEDFANKLVFYIWIPAYLMLTTTI